MRFRAHRWSCHKRCNNLLRRVRCNLRPDFNCGSGAIMNLGGDASATHGDGVCAVISSRELPKFPSLLSYGYAFSRSQPACCRLHNCEELSLG